MVIVNLSGGLGNQLFQYAVSRNVAYNLDTELKLDLSSAKVSLNPKTHANYRLGDFNIQENIATPEEIAAVKATGVFVPPFQRIQDANQDVYIQGHAFHSESAFSGVADIIRQEFTLKNPLHKISAAWEEKILAAECSVSLHIRHGDYVNAIHIVGVIPLDYYKTCTDELKKIFPNITAFVFSDDLKWVRENLSLNVPTEFVADCESDNEEFYLMSICKHNVIANSTFSWWAAWLNPNPDKKVFAPLPWARSGLWDNEIPASWTRIPVDYNNVPIDAAPLLSIIVYVKNNVSSLMLLFSCIVSQTLKDCELILIDDGSTDGSEHICRQVSLDDKVTFIGSGGLGKARAWNKGLDFARGEYVMFLSGDDRIFQNTVQSLCEVYSTQRPSVVCAVQYLEEHPDGDSIIDGIEGKKYFHRIDENFKGMKDAYVLKDNDLSRKLMMAGTHVFNPFLGTKFFYREFLEKNILRFNENVTEDFELLFLANAIMQSNEIAFITKVFYVAPRK